MKILLTGATGYIGKRLLPVLVNQGHHVVCCVRDVKRFNPPQSLYNKIEIIELDFLVSNTIYHIPKDIDAAYYLIHSMSTSTKYNDLERNAAINFRNALNKTKVEQVIYLSGISNEEKLSKHLASRRNVENELSKGNFSLTTLRAGIIIGSGSASFEIIRDLVEKLPVMITPKWLRTKCQPIGIYDVIEFIDKSLFNKKTYDRNFDIGGPDILTYKQMLLGFARMRKLKRYIWVVPVMTPRLSSYWLYFITSTSYKLAIALVNSMKVEVVCRDNEINQILGITPLSYSESLQKTFSEIQDNQIISSWKDSLVSANKDIKISDFINVPVHGCFIDKRMKETSSPDNAIQRVWSIGGTTGWYYANWLWLLRGFIDKLNGGVGLRRGRTNVNTIATGDVIDFWRVLYANKQERRLLLFAEMKLPGEAWLEFHIDNNVITQIATFRPKGLWGRIYWYLVYPFHGLIFKGMLRNIAN